MAKPIGYMVSSPRIPEGRFFKTLREARREMSRQIRTGSTQSGISEVMSRETWNQAKRAHRVYKFKQRLRKVM